MCDYLKKNWHNILSALLLIGLAIFVWFIHRTSDIILELYKDDAFNYTLGLLAIMIAIAALTFNAISNIREIKNQEAEQNEKRMKYLKIQIQNVYYPVNALLKNIEDENCIKIINEIDVKELR